MCLSGARPKVGPKRNGAEQLQRQQTRAHSKVMLTLLQTPPTVLDCSRMSTFRPTEVSTLATCRPDMPAPIWNI